MLSFQEQDQVVEGGLYELEAPESFWPVFDSLVGVDPMKPSRSTFWRQEVFAMVDNFTQVPCFVYGLNPHKKKRESKKIHNGDWKKDMDGEAPFANQLKPRHKDYLLKLSKTKGRDIVPIQLDLYRELLSMELIVDKGRRLALTKLGKETSLFLQ